MAKGQTQALLEGIREITKQLTHRAYQLAIKEGERMTMATAMSESPECTQVNELLGASIRDSMRESLTLIEMIETDARALRTLITALNPSLASKGAKE